ncbi:MAG: M28 family peptidase, partial [Candidatus Thermoplasmatota archaeon]|nr:M28 family peptidase [Candidatus Thermoplasmatota archaeon]
MGSSDHVSFADVGVPAFKIFGAKENYPAYHTPDDTFDTMVAFMGDEETLAKGFAVPAWLGFYLTVYAEENFQVSTIFAPEEI